MKKLLVILMLLASTVLYGKPVKEGTIGSFNVLRLGQSDKNYEELTEIISMMDIVGLVEVSTKRGIKVLVDELEKNTGEEWGYHVSSYPVGSKKYKEYYGYVWKKDKVEFVKSNGFYKERNYRFIREPYAATFKMGEFDFTFVLLHAIYGKNKQVREKEAQGLGDVYSYFQNQDALEQDILIGGDFNLPVGNKAFYNLFKHEDNIMNTIPESVKTTIGMNRMANQYDNIFISRKYTNKEYIDSGYIDITANGYRYARENLSDHVPVFIVVDTTKDDD